jgi:hypothetical protein
LYNGDLFGCLSVECSAFWASEWNEWTIILFHSPRNVTLHGFGFSLRFKVWTSRSIGFPSTYGFDSYPSRKGSPCNKGRCRKTSFTSEFSTRSYIGAVVSACDGWNKQFDTQLCFGTSGSSPDRSSNSDYGRGWLFERKGAVWSEVSLADISRSARGETL